MWQSCMPTYLSTGYCTTNSDLIQNYHCTKFYNLTDDFTAPFVLFPPSLSHFHSVRAKLPNKDLTAQNILLILPPLSHFHSVSAPILILVLPSLSLFLFVGIDHSAAPNLGKLMAKHSTLFHYSILLTMALLLLLKFSNFLSITPITYTLATKIPLTLTLFYL
jgi:hypothetical protein